jgi:hypothetical protein
MVSPTRIRAAVEADLDAMLGLVEQLFALESDFPFEAAKVRRGLELLHARSRFGSVVGRRTWMGSVVGMCSAQIVISTAEGGPAGLGRGCCGQSATKCVAWVSAVMLLDDSLRLGRSARGIGRLQLLADAENARRPWLLPPDGLANHPIDLFTPETWRVI